MRGGGRPLPSTVRSYFEPRFGSDFSDVRVHATVRAADLSQRLNARAFTLGRNLFFANGEYEPNSILGRRLLAHELVHVIQQRGHSIQGDFLQRQPIDPPGRSGDELATQPEIAPPPNALSLDLLNPDRSSLRIQGFSISPRDILDALDIAKDFLTPEAIDLEGLNLLRPPPTAAQERAMREALCRRLPMTCVQLRLSPQAQAPPPSPTLQLRAPKILQPILVPHRDYVFTHFTYEKAAVPPRHYTPLDQIATQMIDYPSIFADFVGHTDSHGPSGYNMRLSKRRAQAVFDYMRNRRVPILQLWDVEGRGETQLAYPNDRRDWLAAARNRRVEIKQRRIVWEVIYKLIPPITVTAGPERKTPETDAADLYQQMTRFLIVAHRDIHTLVSRGTPVNYTESSRRHTLPVADNENVTQVLNLLDRLVEDMRSNRLAINFDRVLNPFGGSAASYTATENTFSVARFRNNREAASVAVSLLHEYLHAIQDRTAEQLLRAGRQPIVHSRELELQQEIQAHRVDNYFHILLEASGHPLARSITRTFVNQFEIIRTGRPSAQAEARRDVRTELEPVYTASGQLGFYPMIRFLVEIRGNDAYLIRGGGVETRLVRLPASPTPRQVRGALLTALGSFRDYSKLFNAPDGSRYKHAYFVVVRGTDVVTEFITKP